MGPWRPCLTSPTRQRAWSRWSEWGPSGAWSRAGDFLWVQTACEVPEPVKEALNFVKHQGTIVDFLRPFLPDSWLKWITWLLFYTDKKFLIFIFSPFYVLMFSYWRVCTCVFKFHDSVGRQRETLFCLFLFALYNISVTAYTKADTLGFSLHSSSDFIFIFFDIPRLWP